MATATYKVDEISAGIEDDCLWVSICFSSDLEKEDVLHVVCATRVDAQDRALGHNAIYLERFDQAYSCYAGAESITAAAAGIEVVLNPEGATALALPVSVSFVQPGRLEGWPNALHVFGRMTAEECGRVVSVAEHVPGESMRVEGGWL